MLTRFASHAMLIAFAASCTGNADEKDVVGIGADALGTEWSPITTTSNTLVLNSSTDLLVNSPFYGIQVTRNGKDITDDIKEVKQLSPRSWRYTFATETLNVPGETISISLDNHQVATPGHYLAIHNFGANTPEKLYKRLQDCQAGVGECAGNGPLPDLLDGKKAVKGFTRRYAPRDLAKSGGGYDFSPIFADAAYLAERGLKLNVGFEFKSFSSQTEDESSDGVTKTFELPSSWDPSTGRNYEVRAYVDGAPATFSFNTAKTHVTLTNTPPTGSHVVVAHARDPFPPGVWNTVGGWYVGTFNHVYGFNLAPWRPACVSWMKDFLQQFQTAWTKAIEDAELAGNPKLKTAIDSLSTQETANGLTTNADYDPIKYIDNLTEISKFYARAVRRRAAHEVLINFVTGTNSDAFGGFGGGTEMLAKKVIPWGARLGGPDLFNGDGAGLENGAYQRVHRAQHDRTLTMIWAQHDSFQEKKPGGGLFTLAEQFAKAKKGVGDTTTAGGFAGLEAEYVFWNMTVKGNLRPDAQADGATWKDALKVISENPTIQTTGHNKNRWRLPTLQPIADQVKSRVNP